MGEPDGSVCVRISIIIRTITDGAPCVVRVSVLTSFLVFVLDFSISLEFVTAEHARLDTSIDGARCIRVLSIYNIKMSQLLGGSSIRLPNSSNLISLAA